MSLYICHAGRRTALLDFAIEHTCPHCQTYAHLTPIALPRFEQAKKSRPQKLGIGYSCDACKQPVFLNFGVLHYAHNYIELNAAYQVIDTHRPKLNIQLDHPVAKALLEEAWVCLDQTCLHAFTMVCQQLVRTVAKDQGPQGTLKVFNVLREAASLAQVSNRHFLLFRTALFTQPNTPMVLNHEQAWILLELLKDALYQLYARAAELQQAMPNSTNPALTPASTEQQTNTPEKKSPIAVTPAHWHAA